MSALGMNLNLGHLQQLKHLDGTCDQTDGVQAASPQRTAILIGPGAEEDEVTTAICQLHCAELDLHCLA